jgi:hypothetical protein
MERSLFCRPVRPKIAVRMQNRMIPSTSKLQLLNNRMLDLTASKYDDVM